MKSHKTAKYKNVTAALLGGMRTVVGNEEGEMNASLEKMGNS